jgi:hypothetical protein
MHRSQQVGVLTFHRCINYGSYWQARCLVDGLRSLGHDAVLLDHRSPRIDQAEWRCALHPVPAAPRSSYNRRQYAAKTRRFQQAFDALPMSAPFPIDRPHEAPRVGRTVVGSDEVWNLRHPWYGGQPVFFGAGLDTELLSYAASFGNQDADAGLEPYWTGLLQSFSSIAVRDQNSHRLVAKALQRDPHLVLDPCLQFSEQIESSTVDVDGPVDGPYVAIYGHSFPEGFSRAVRGWADARGARLISIGYRNDWADHQWIDAGPLDYAGFIGGASAVVTNFFHGCVFSLVNRKPFICAPSDYRNNKVRDLLTLVQAPERLLPQNLEAETVEDLLARAPAEHTYVTLADLRRASHEYLQHALH